jgi:secretion/DNA translocation related TadE-like protein
MRTEGGSGAAGTLIVVSGVIAVTSFLLLAGSSLVVFERAQALTDQAALEAADAASGRIPGYPCDRAERLAESTHIIFGSCDVQNLVARVTMKVTVLGFLIETRAKAGPKIRFDD